MSDFDTFAYEREQAAERTRVEGVLRKLPAYHSHAERHGGRGPQKTLTCAKGHRLLDVFAEDDGERILLRPRPDHRVRKSGAVTRPAEPWLLPTVCATPGCPTQVERYGNCDEHGGPVEDIGSVRTGFRCRQCGDLGAVRTAYLLQRYGFAVHLGLDEIRIASPSAQRSALG